MLEGLDQVPWAKLRHAYGSARDVPDLLRKLPDPDPEVRRQVMHELYGNLFHQGTRYPATPYAIPFLIELCGDPGVPGRGELLEYWGHLIAGDFSVRERPMWGDGTHVYWGREPMQARARDPYVKALHAIYRESLAGYELLQRLLSDPETPVRAGAAWVLACLPTRSVDSIPLLEGCLAKETSEVTRTALAFALGELEGEGPLRRLAETDTAAMVRCMATCQLARFAPGEDLLEPLVRLITDPIEGYEEVPGAGGPSTGDAAFSIRYLPPEVRPAAIPALLAQLNRARKIETMPYVIGLLSAAFSPQEEPVTQLNPLQREVLTRMARVRSLWGIGNNSEELTAYGLPWSRSAVERLLADAD